jgi:glutathione-regulated potassium-efflux system protein KefB
MEHATQHGGFLAQILIFLAAAVIAVPLFRLAGLSAVLGYLAAGIAIGPSGFGLFKEPGTLTGIAELGVVMFLFIIGLELKLSKLMALRRDIIVLGIGQMVTTAAAILCILWLLGYTLSLALVCGVALALSATAIALQMLEEGGHLQSPGGQKAFAILLFQDISVVPVLALLPLTAPGGSTATSMAAVAGQSANALLALVAIVLAGRYLLNPLFQLLGRFGAREVMTAAALLVVLGSAVLMNAVGMSMALGAFLAGLLLAESDFRHELEADIEPFRGLLLGLFFMAIGMSLDLQLVLANAALILGGALVLVLLKLVLAATVMALSGMARRDIVRSAPVLTPAGEFAFVLLPLAAQLGFITGPDASTFTALAALSMLLGPLVAKGIEFLVRRVEARRPAETMEEDYEGAGGRALVIGFGRFGQVVTQVLLAAEVNLTVIDNNVDSIKSAARFGFKVYFGDGTRLDVLRAAGAGQAKLICICIDNVAATLAIVEMVQANFPLAKLHVRAYDRISAIDLMGQNVDYVMRETLESALSFGGQSLTALGESPELALERVEDVRNRDRERLEAQRAAGLFGGVDLLRGTKVQPEPLAAPKRKPKALNAETEDLIAAPARADTAPGSTAGAQT